MTPQPFVVSCTTGMQGKRFSFTATHMLGHFFFGLLGGVAVTRQHAVMALLRVCAQQRTACLCRLLVLVLQMLSRISRSVHKQTM